MQCGIFGVPMQKRFIGAFARAAADITPQIAAQLYAEQYPMLGYPTLENPAQ